MTDWLTGSTFRSCKATSSSFSFLPGIGSLLRVCCVLCVVWVCLFLGSLSALFPPPPAPPSLSLSLSFPLSFLPSPLSRRSAHSRLRGFKRGPLVLLIPAARSTRRSCRKASRSDSRRKEHFYPLIRDLSVNLRVNLGPGSRRTKPGSILSLLRANIFNENRARKRGENDGSSSFRRPNCLPHFKTA